MISWKVSFCLSPSFSPFERQLFRLECKEHSHPSLVKSLLLDNVSAWEAQNILLCDTHACVTRAGARYYFTLFSLSISISLGIFINFAAALPKNNIVERERNTDSSFLNRESLIFHSRGSRVRFSESPLYRWRGYRCILPFWIMAMYLLRQ